MVQRVMSIKLAINVCGVSEGLIVVRFPSPPLEEELFKTGY